MSCEKGNCHKGCKSDCGNCGRACHEWKDKCGDKYSITLHSDPNLKIALERLEEKYAELDELYNSNNLSAESIEALNLYTTNANLIPSITILFPYQVVIGGVNGKEE